MHHIDIIDKIEGQKILARSQNYPSTQLREIFNGKYFEDWWTEFHFNTITIQHMIQLK